MRQHAEALCRELFILLLAVNAALQQTVILIKAETRIKAVVLLPFAFKLRLFGNNVEKTVPLLLRSKLCGIFKRIQTGNGD